jgi:hypothetical protein
MKHSNSSIKKTTIRRKKKPIRRLVCIDSLIEVWKFYTVGAHLLHPPKEENKAQGKPPFQPNGTHG